MVIIQPEKKDRSHHFLVDRNMDVRMAGLQLKSHKWVWAWTLPYLLVDVKSHWSFSLSNDSTLGTAYQRSSRLNDLQNTPVLLVIDHKEGIPKPQNTSDSYHETLKLMHMNNIHTHKNCYSQEKKNTQTHTRAHTHIHTQSKVIYNIFDIKVLGDLDLWTIVKLPH